MPCHGTSHAQNPGVESMEQKKTGQIDRRRSDFDVMEHVINGWYPPMHRQPQPRGRADDRDQAEKPGGQKTTHSRPKLRHK